MSETEFYEAESITPSITQDGQFVVLTIQVGESTPFRVGLPHQAAADLASALVVVNSASVRPDPTLSGSTGFTRMTPVASADAHATDQPGEIALGLVDKQGHAHYFALPTQASAALRSQIRNAEVASKSGARLPEA